MAITVVAFFFMCLGLATEGIIFYTAATLVLLFIAVDYYRICVLKHRLLQSLAARRDLSASEIYLGSSARLACRLAYHGKGKMMVRATQPLADGLNGNGRWPPVLLSPGSTATLETTLKPSMSGTFTITPPEVRVETWLFKDSLAPGDALQLTVYLPIGSPPSRACPPGPRGGSSVSVFDATTVKTGTGTDFLSVRSYAAGDSLKRIDWARSSHANGLVVREYEDSQPMPIFFIVDLDPAMGIGGPGSGLSSATDLATAVINNALANDERIGLACFSGSDIVNYLPAGMGPEHLYKVRKLLSSIKPVEDSGRPGRQGQDTLPYDLKSTFVKDRCLDSFIDDALKGYMANIEDDGFSMTIKRSLKSLDTSSLIIVLTNLSMGMASLLNGTRIARYYGHRVSVVLLPHAWHEDTGAAEGRITRSLATLKAHGIGIIVLRPGQRAYDVIRASGVMASKAGMRG